MIDEQFVDISKWESMNENVVYFAFGADVSNSTNSLTGGWNHFPYGIVEPVASQDIAPVSRTGCQDHEKLFKRMCLGALPPAVEEDNITWYTFPFRRYRHRTYDLELTCNNLCKIYTKGWIFYSFNIQLNKFI